jgi:hypothetical protein
MLTKTRLHRVRLLGGFKEELHKDLLPYFEKSGKLSDYLSKWTRPKCISNEDWLTLVSPENEETTKLTYPKYDDCDVTVQDSELVKFVMVGQEHFKVVESFEIEVDVATGADQAEMYFLKTMQIMEKYQSQLERLSENTFNTKCNLHAGGAALSQYNQTMLCEDICTDVLQSKLHEGWRILAVCVQPDQRRPDYVLGKFVPPEEVSMGAERGY